LLMQSNKNSEPLSKQYLDIAHFYSKFKTTQEEKLNLGYGEKPPIYILLNIFANNINREMRMVTIRAKENIIRKLSIGMDLIAHTIKNDILKNNSMQLEVIKFDMVEISELNE